MKFDLKTWLIIGLVTALALVILFQPTNESQKVKDLEAKVKSREDAIFQLHRESLKRAEKIKADSLKQASDKIAYQTTIKKKDVLIANLRANPVVIKIREETPEVDSLLDAMEAKDSIQTERIATLEANLKELRVDLAGITFNFQERLDLQSESLADLTAITNDQRKQIRKLRRATRLLKVATVVGFIGGVFLGSQ